MNIPGNAAGITSEGKSDSLELKGNLPQLCLLPFPSLFSCFAVPLPRKSLMRSNSGVLGCLLLDVHSALHPLVIGVIPHNIPMENNSYLCSHPHKKPLTEING